MVMRPIEIVVLERDEREPMEDRIVGRMVRDLIAFEGEPAAQATFDAVDRVIVEAIGTAGRAGVRPDYVEAIARRMTYHVVDNPDRLGSLSVSKKLWRG